MLLTVALKLDKMIVLLEYFNHLLCVANLTSQDYQPWYNNLPSYYADIMPVDDAFEYLASYYAKNYAGIT